MTIKELKNRIQQLEREHGNIDECSINYRHSNNSDALRVTYMEEDLFDEENNNILDSVVFMHLCND